MNRLIGKKITDIRINDDGTLLFFNTDNGIFGYLAYGLCCSASFFYEINGIDALLNKVVINALDMHLEEVKTSVKPGKYLDDKESLLTADIAEYNGTDFDACITLYGIQLQTMDGRCDFVLRNFSNGFYTGCIDFREGPKEKIDEDYKKAKTITTDWKADQKVNIC